uniref:Uncharacterized protein LOC111138073 isoform X2 n=1 Tax=Crassostrea virginica TaxID=6565 RepID=A0A8B8F1A7_CRAVI|nr:uncharacterized protein LOC111138073 isoform X2 [Crassostrea virginica]
MLSAESMFMLTNYKEHITPFVGTSLGKWSRTSVTLKQFGAGGCSHLYGAPSGVRDSGNSGVSPEMLCMRDLPLRLSPAKPSPLFIRLKSILCTTRALEDMINV